MRILEKYTIWTPLCKFEVCSTSTRNSSLSRFRASSLLGEAFGSWSFFSFYKFFTLKFQDLKKFTLFFPLDFAFGWGFSEV
jgi:hypothetical protein